MVDYLLRLLLLVPLVGGMAVAALWLWKRVQQGALLGGAARERAVRVVDAVPMGATSRLAVVDFEGRRLLLAVSRSGITLVAESQAPAPFPPVNDGR